MASYYSSILYKAKTSQGMLPHGVDKKFLQVLSGGHDSNDNKEDTNMYRNNDYRKSDTSSVHIIPFCRCFTNLPV